MIDNFSFLLPIPIILDLYAIVKLILIVKCVNRKYICTVPNK